MASVDIAGESYDAYVDVDFANVYLAADVQRAPVWAALPSEDVKGQAIVSATRLLQRQTWKAGAPPDIEDPPQVVKEATALLAADIAAQPKLGDSGSTASNIKAVGAGSARVEFFQPISGAAVTPLPTAAFDLLKDLLGLPLSDTSDPALDGTAYGSYPAYSRFPPDEAACDGPYDVRRELW